MAERKPEEIGEDWARLMCLGGHEEDEIQEGFMLRTGDGDIYAATRAALYEAASTTTKGN